MVKTGSFVLPMDHDSFDKVCQSIKWKSFAAITLIFAACFLLTYINVTQNIKAENGFKRYAEKTHWMGKYLPPLPLSTLISVFYVLLGLFWIKKIDQIEKLHLLDRQDSFYFYGLAWYAVLYGPVQFAHMLFQRTIFYVVEQWFSLMAFMWIIVWCLKLSGKTSNLYFYVIIIASWTSYLSETINPLGFEVSLGVHVALAFILSLLVLAKNWSNQGLLAFTASLFFCLWFVILKPMDRVLPNYGRVFQYVSGYFLSKVANIGQLYFVFRFFYVISTDNSTTRKKLF